MHHATIAKLLIYLSPQTWLGLEIPRNLPQGPGAILENFATSVAHLAHSIRTIQSKCRARCAQGLDGCACVDLLNL